MSDVIFLENSDRVQFKGISRASPLNGERELATFDNPHGRNEKQLLSLMQSVSDKAMGWSGKCMHLQGLLKQPVKKEEDRINLAEPDADLQVIVERWSELPDAVKAGILAMVRATRIFPVDG